MATYYIRNEGQLKDLVLRKISRRLLEYVSKKVVKIMQDNLEKSSISTSSLQDCVTYQIDTSGIESTIYIDYLTAQTSFGMDAVYEDGKMVEWGRFRNSFGSQFNGDTWHGQYISFKVSEWLENGGPMGVGNQPIQASHWFTKTKQEVETNLQSWAREYLRQNGFI